MKTGIFRRYGSRLMGVLGALAVTAAAARSHAEEVWRLAGSFNNWNTRDGGWVMAPKDNAPGVFVVERLIEQGKYTFKFVKNGDWGAGHLGAAMASAVAGGLDQPGDNISLHVSARAVYRITLDTRTRTWSVAVSRIDQPVVTARVLGQPVVGQSFVLDLGTSLLNNPAAATFEITSPDQKPTLAPVEGQRLQARVTPEKTGPLTLEVALRDGQAKGSASVKLDVQERYSLGVTLATDPPGRFRVQSIAPIGGGVSRALVNIEADTTISSLSVSRGTEQIHREADVPVKRGTYVVEIRDGKLARSGEGESAPVLLPGHWRRFTYKPGGAPMTVELIGEFNNFISGSQPGAIPMASAADGAFETVVDVPEGAHRYQFLVDGGTRVVDPTSPKTVTWHELPYSVVVAGPTPAEFGLPKPNAIVGEAVRHHPTLRSDFEPIEDQLGLADLSVLALPGDAERADAVIKESLSNGQSVEVRVPLAREPDLSGFDRWSGRVMFGSPTAEYRFELFDGSARFATKAFTAVVQPNARLNHPAWAMGAVWYQIFPERFRNGNRLNDPHGPGVTLMPWTHNWYSVSKEEELAWKKRAGLKPEDPLPPHRGGPIFNVVWDRRYGGDLQGIVEKIPYLKDLGITALYLNPIFQAESMHKYDATDYRHIDVNLSSPASAGRVPERYEFDGEPADPKTWTWLPQDEYFIKEFLPAMKKAGIRVVLDGVFNHTGMPFFAFRDIQKNGDKSPYKDWFFVTFDEQGKLKSWESWFNTGALPKFRQTATGDLVAPVKEHIFNITRRWMDPNGDGDPSDGIDGWRLDVALDVGLPFWKDWRALVKSINPDAIIIAEIWDDASPYLTGDAFDTQMHYPFVKPLVDWLGVKPGTGTRELEQQLASAFNDPPQTNLIHQNLMGSHDTDRYVSMLFNPGRGYDQRNRKQDEDGKDYKDTKPSPEAYRMSLLGVAVQALYTGAPMIYYGDEIGMWGADDPTDRKPYPWPDLGPNDNPDDNPVPGMLEQYQRWFKLRHDPVLGPVLRFGDLKHLDAGDPDVFAFQRSLNGVRVIGVVNRGSKSFDAAKLLPAGTPNTVVEPVSAREFSIVPEGAPRAGVELPR
ncbi:MAG: hypothetical protein IBJ11_00605 [Phycisphaerales bacterium]|nr:hypothetical protein [Phycisphaerales bacterium]